MKMIDQLSSKFLKKYTWLIISKSNFFIENDILKAKLIDISISIDIALIDSYKIIVSIRIEVKSFSQKRTVHVKTL